MGLSALKARQAEVRAGFSLSRIGLSDTPDWSIVDGALVHRSGGFFCVTGLRAVGAAPGDPSERVMLYQPQGAFNGLLTRRHGDRPREFLIQARAEPGNVGEIQFGPTVQSTPANYLRLHGGAATPYIEAFLGYAPTVRILEETTQLDLGERYFGKTKRVVLAEDRGALTAEPPFVWADAETIVEATAQSYFLNTDLRSAIALSPWTVSPDSGDLVPRAEAFRRSLAAPVRPDRLGALAAALATDTGHRQDFVPLDGLARWEITEQEIRETTRDQGFSVIFVDIAAALREKTHWTQPLLESDGAGEVVLACRRIDGVAEVLVRVVRESGFWTSAGLLPSWLRYPGEAKQPPAWLDASKPLLATEESDEGGRFYHDASAYRVVELPSGMAIDPADGQWLRLSELKRCLAQSSLCAIQLRVIASHLLAVPDAAFGPR